MQRTINARNASSQPYRSWYRKLHVLDRKDFFGNILDNIENTVIFVLRHTNLEYKIEKLIREEIPEIPEVALREAIVNAVCHKDYFEKGANVMIEIIENAVKEFGKYTVFLRLFISKTLLRPNGQFKQRK